MANALEQRVAGALRRLAELADEGGVEVLDEDHLLVDGEVISFARQEVLNDRIVYFHQGEPNDPEDNIFKAVHEHVHFRMDAVSCGRFGTPVQIGCRTALFVLGFGVVIALVSAYDTFHNRSGQFPSTVSSLCWSQLTPQGVFFTAAMLLGGGLLLKSNCFSALLGRTLHHLFTLSVVIVGLVHTHPNPVGYQWTQTFVHQGAAFCIFVLCPLCILIATWPRTKGSDPCCCCRWCVHILARSEYFEPRFITTPLLKRIRCFSASGLTFSLIFFVCQLSEDASNYSLRLNMFSFACEAICAFFVFLLLWSIPESNLKWPARSAARKSS